MRSMTDETETLVRDASQGTVGAVDELLARYLPGLRAYVRRRAGRLIHARESSSDVVQSVCREVLERLADQRFEYRGEEAFRRWLYQAAVLKMRDRRRFWLAERRDAGREVSPPDGSGAPGPAVFRASGTPSQEAGRREDVERVRAALRELPPNYRRVIELAQLEGRPHREVAAELGITEAHSRVLLSRALARLARLGARRPPPDATG